MQFSTELAKPTVDEWTAEDIYQWLTSHGISDTTAGFLRSHQVDGVLAQHITAEDLQHDLAMGITSDDELTEITRIMQVSRDTNAHITYAHIAYAHIAAHIAYANITYIAYPHITYITYPQHHESNTVCSYLLR